MLSELTGMKGSLWNHEALTFTCSNSLSVILDTMKGRDTVTLLQSIRSSVKMTIDLVEILGLYLSWHERGKKTARNSENLISIFTHFQQVFSPWDYTKSFGPSLVWHKWWSPWKEEASSPLSSSLHLAASRSWRTLQHFFSLYIKSSTDVSTNHDKFPD